MGWRFRKSIRIAKGFNLNLSRRGPSVSAGVPGSGWWWSASKPWPKRRRADRQEMEAAGGNGCLGVLGLAAIAGCVWWFWPAGSIVAPVPTEPAATSVRLYEPAPAAKDAEGFGRAEAADPKEEPPPEPVRVEAPKGPDAATLLKMGRNLESRNPAAARKYFRELIEAHPDSPEAKAAEKRIKAMGSASR